MILLENQADVNPSDIKGDTPLHFCCNNGHMDSATLLMIVGGANNMFYLYHFYSMVLM